MVLASNPSFSEIEAYPTWQQEWDKSKLEEFGADRFTSDESRGFGAIDSKKNRDRTINLDGTFSKQVAYWTEIRGRVAEILGKDRSQTSAITDYVMTELVHCKSHSEFGVSESLKQCSDLWLDRIMALSPAKLVIVMGVKPAKHLIELFPEIPNTWGCWKEDDGTIRSFWPNKISLASDIKSGKWNFDSQKLHTVELEMGGKLRKVVWLPRPNSSYIRNLSTPGLIDERLFAYWRS